MEPRIDIAQPSKPRLKPEIALVIGMAIKAAFLLTAWYMLCLVAPVLSLYSTTSARATITVILGDFLTGLVVGFLVKARRKGALSGFLSSALAGVFLFAILGFGTRDPVVISVSILMLPFDVLALIGGAIGASLNLKTFALATMLTLILVASITIQGFISAPIGHSGYLIIQANQTLTIENCVYLQDGDIIVKENATLTIKNAELIMDQKEHKHQVEISDTAHLIAENIRFSTITTGGKGKVVDSPIHVRDNANVVISKSEVLSSPLIASQFSRVTIANSKWGSYFAVQSSNQSNISISNSFMQHVSSYDFSSFLSKNSSVAWYHCYNHSRLLVEDSSIIGTPVRTYGYIHCYDDSYIVVKNSTIDGIITHAFQGEACFDKAAINEVISVDNLTSFYVYGNVTVNGEVKDFNGTMTRNYMVIANPNMQLNVTNRDTGRLLWNDKANDYGYSSFNVTFTPANYTNHLVLNNEKEVTLTSTAPLTLDSTMGSWEIEVAPLQMQTQIITFSKSHDTFLCSWLRKKSLNGHYDINAF